MAVGRAAIPSQSPVAAALIAASAGADPCPAPDSAAGSPDGALLATFANGRLQALCQSVDLPPRRPIVAFPSWQEFGVCGASMP